MADDLPMTRARLYVLIDAFERDIRSILMNFVISGLSGLSEEEALGSFFAGASDRQSQDATPSDHLVDYLYLREGYDLLNTHRRLLPEELASEIRSLTRDLDRVVGVRQRVMHARPLQAGDSDATVSLLNMYQTRYWPELKRTVAHLLEDPTWEPIVTIKGDAGYALHNLPLPEYDETGLIGRSKESDYLVQQLKKRRQHVMTVTGEGGIGKTALAVDVAFRLVDDPDQPFDAVLWTSLKFERLTATGIRAIAGAARDVIGAVQPLGQAFDSDFDGSVRDLASVLEGSRVLIVVDNLETMGGTEFLALYDELPETVSYLVTSRVGIGELERRYALEPLSPEDSLRLFNNFVKGRRISALQKISNDLRVQVITRLRHSPLAIRWFALAVDAGNDPIQLLHDQDQLLEFCVRSVYDSLAPKAAEILAALTILGRPVSVDELVLLLDRSTDHVNEAVQELARGSLVRRENLSPGELAQVVSLTETAREFMGRRVQPDPEFQRELTRRESEYRQTEERREIDMANRSLAPVVIWSRSPSDGATAQMLRRAVLRCHKNDMNSAIDEVKKARKLNPDFPEVDRVEGYIRSVKGELGEATACYKRGYENAVGDNRGVVAHFFAGHLARRVNDTKAALEYAREAHEILQLKDTAIALGNYLVWLRQFSEGIALIEPAAVAVKGRARLIAITSLTRAYRRWSEYSLNEERNPTLAYAQARKGAGIALATLHSGVSDDKLRDAGAECCISTLRAAEFSLRASGSVPDLPEWLKELTMALVRFVHSNSWQYLVAETGTLARTRGVPTNARKLARAAAAIDEQIVGNSSGSSAPDGDLIGEIIRLRDRFGFLRHPAYPNDVYFRHDAVVGDGGFDSLRSGALVYFSVVEEDKGPRAVNVRLAI